MGKAMKPRRTLMAMKSRRTREDCDGKKRTLEDIERDIARVAARPLELSAELDSIGPLFPSMSMRCRK